MAGHVHQAFAPVADVFHQQIESGQEVGAGLTVYYRGECVVDLWGGLADRESRRPWDEHTRIVVFSVTKGLAAMAMHLLVDRGLAEWDAPVARWWPEFGALGREHITLRQLMNHQAGLAALDVPITLLDCAARNDPDARARVTNALLQQRPNWESATSQGYHAITYGLYVNEVFERIAGEDMGTFLHREWLDPVGSDARLGSPESLDDQLATLYPPTAPERLGNMLRVAVRAADTPDGRLARDIVRRDSLTRRAFFNPSLPGRDVTAYNRAPAVRAVLPWASATSTARGIARAYLPMAMGGTWNGHTYLSESTITPVFERQGWSERDRVLHKPIGWSQGFVKEEATTFSPVQASFGHPGLGGALGWCDPVNQLTIGYVMNRMDWRIRSPRAVALCQALYRCAPLANGR